MAKQTENTTTPSSDSEFCRVYDLAIVDFVRPMLADIVHRADGKFTERGILEAVAGGYMQMWLGTSSKEVTVIVLTEITQYDSTRRLCIIAVTGKDRRNWLDNIEILKQYARDNHCSKIEAWARPGWERVLKDWKKTHVLLEMGLDDA